MAERLSAMDAAFLDLDHEDAPLHVGATLVLDGPPPTLASLRRHLDGRLDRAPRLRRRVLDGDALGLLGDAVWVDDPGFDIGRHVHEVAVPRDEAAADPEAAVAELAGVLLSTALTPGRPLWRMYLVRGLPDGWALVVQIHHVLLDGIAAMTLAGMLLDLEPDPAPSAAPAWRPAPAPGLVPNAAASARGRAADGLRTGASAIAGLRDAGALARAAQGATSALTGSTVPTSLDGGTGPERAVAFARTPLDQAREAGRRHHATVNHVLLAATSLAVTAALDRRAEPVERLRVLVPVNVREAGDDPFGNRISFLACELPVGQDDPIRVLRHVRRQMHERTAAGQARPLAAITRAADALPAAGRRQLVRTIAGRVAFSAIVSNVPGPPMPLYLHGRRLRAAYPAVPILRGRALTVGALSYDGTLHLGLYADAGTITDLPRLADDLGRAFAALHAALRPAPTPWQQRARARRHQQTG